MRRFLGLALLLLLLVPAGVETADAAPAADNSYALLIGINVHQPKTRNNVGGVGDVEEMRLALMRSGWRADHIRTLTDRAATADGIRAGLQWLVSKSTEGGFSVFSYSGHVKQSGRTEYLWPHDNRHIPDTELAASLRQLKGRAWINISGCEAAGFDEGVSAPNRLFTASSRATEKSYEYPEAANSVFTWLMVERGLSGGQADANKDGRVSIQEAFRYAADRAPGMTAGQRHGAQTPQIAGGDGTEWFLGFDRPNTGPAPAPAPCFFIFCIFAP